MDEFNSEALQRLLDKTRSSTRSLQRLHLEFEVTPDHEPTTVRSER